MKSADIQTTAAGSISLSALVDSAGRYAAAAVSQNTSRAYRADWSHFADWCASVDLVPMPAGASTVGAYITSLADAGAAAATIDRACAWPGGASGALHRARSRAGRASDPRGRVRDLA